MSFEDFIDNFKDIEGIRVVSFNKNTNSVYYELLEEKTQKEIDVFGVKLIKVVGVLV